MRRLWFGTSLAMLLGLATAVLAGDYGYYRDDFPAQIYNGSTGNLDWSNSPWREIGDDGGVATGAVRVDYTPEQCADEYKCLQISADDGLAEPIGAERFADLTVLQNAELCFELAGEGDLAETVLKVYVTADGSNWTKVKTYQGIPDYDHPVVDVSDWISTEFGVRFLVSAPMSGTVFIDSVELKGDFASTSTTATTEPVTTTTKATTSTTKATITTTSEPTTTTTWATTTTIADITTTTGNHETTTTQQNGSTTTTEVPSETAPTDTPGKDAETSSTQPTEETTTTTEPESGETPDSEIVIPPVGPPPDSGLRETDKGVQASYEPGLYGSLATSDGVEVLGAEYEANYQVAAEVIRSSWIFVIVLAVVVTGAIVSGIDRRRANESIAEA